MPKYTTLQREQKNVINTFSNIEGQPMRNKPAVAQLRQEDINNRVNNQIVKLAEVHSTMAK